MRFCIVISGCNLHNDVLQDIEVITEDGAPSGRKDFVVWDPAPIDPLEPTLGRQNAMQEAITLMCYLMKRGIRTILCVLHNFHTFMFLTIN